MPQTSEYYRRSITFWIVLLILAGVVYYPGLFSSFQLDDIDNLAGLVSVPDSGIFNYILGGINYPSGRPLSLFTFALQYSAWPDNPFAFKVVNLFIHLACGGLIFLICNRLTRKIIPEDGERMFFSSLVSAFWLLHPIHLTTVLYAVQRMTQLSSLFVLTGIYLYLHFRDQYIKAANHKNLFGMVAAVWGGTVLAVLSKENGILLPLFILVINFTLLRQDNIGHPKILRWNRLLLGLPLCVVLIYLITGFEKELSSYTIRSFTMGERLMTEAVVLLDYLKSIVFPFPADFSLYHDDFPVSSGILSPVYTLPAVLIILGLLISSFLGNQRFPVYSFSILWFFAGHVLESTYLNLELYFEHRNYLSSFGIFFLLAFLLLRLKQVSTVKWYAHAGITLFAILFLANTLYQIRLWSDPLQHHIEMVEHHPGSARAVMRLGNLYLSGGEFAEAQQYYQGLVETHPDDIYPRIKLMAMEACVFGNSLSDEFWQDLHMRAGTAAMSPYGVTQELVTLSSAVSENDCQAIEINQLISLIVILALNPEYGRQRAVLHELAARLGIVTGDAGVAYHNINAAVRSPKIPRLILKFQILVAMQEYEEAEQTLDEISRRLDENLRLKLAFADRVTQLEQELNAGID